MKKLTVLNYVFVIIIISIILVIVYAAVQQAYRTSANDPQIQLANDIKYRLQQHKPVDNLFKDSIDIRQSLSTFVTIYDAEGKPLQSSGFLKNALPQLPKGVFDYTRKNDEDDITWQPERETRMAIVVVRTGVLPAAFVSAGRSLQQVETREHNLVIMICMGWILCIALILLFAVINFYMNKRIYERK